MGKGPAPSPLAFRIRSSLAADSSSASQVMLVRPEARHRQHLENASRDLLPKLLEARMTAGPVQLGDDVGDGVSDARDLGEPIFCNQRIDTDGESGQSIRCAGVGLGDTDCRRATRSAAHIREAAWLPVANWPLTSLPSGDGLDLRSERDSRLIVLTARAGPRQPRNSSFLFSSALVAQKNCSSSSRARAGR